MDPDITAKRVINTPVHRFHLPPKPEMDTHAELAVPAGGDNIFKAKMLLVSKEGIQYIPGSLKHDLWLMNGT